MNVRVTPNRDGRASGECFGGGIGRLVKGRVAEAKGLSNEPFLNAAATTMLTARIMKPVGSTGPRLEKHQENYRFVRAMIAFRGAHPILSKEEFHTTSEMQWFDPQQGMPDWTNPKCKQIACLIHENGQDGLYLMFNAGTEETHFGLPRLQEGYCWNLSADTSRATPRDPSSTSEETCLDYFPAYRVEARSAAILETRKAKIRVRG